MKKIILSLSLLMSLGIYAHDQSQLEQQLEIKKKQLDALYNQIREQDEKLVHVTERLQELAREFKKEKIKDLQNQKPKLKMTDREINKLILNILSAFFDNFYAENKTKQYLVDDQDSTDERELKFYYLLHHHELLKLKKMLQQLENLSDEIGHLESI